MEGQKFDGSKIRMDLIPMECLTEIAKVLTFGANKYADNDWMKVKGGKERYRGALLRHMAAMQAGEKQDPESGLTHAGHMACCAMFLLYFDLQGGKK